MSKMLRVERKARYCPSGLKAGPTLSTPREPFFTPLMSGVPRVDGGRSLMMGLYISRADSCQSVKTSLALMPSARSNAVSGSALPAERK